MIRRSFALPILLLFVACGGRTLSLPPWDAGQNANANANANATCVDTGDCTIAYRADECCACPTPVTAAQAEADPCLIPVVQSYIPPECAVDCSGVRCGDCPPNTGQVGCDRGQCVWHDGGACGSDHDCVVGVRVDDCCTQAEAMTRQERDADPCLLPFPPPWEIPQVCRDRWSVDCAMLNCTWAPPEYRSVVCGSDGCTTVPECTGESDCVLAVDGNQCCACPDGYPSNMIGRDPCVVPVGEPIPSSCPMMQCEMDCAPCPDAVPTCDRQRCTAVYALSGGQE